MATRNTEASRPAAAALHSPGVRAFRPEVLEGVVGLAGTTSRYAIDPYDEYVLAAVERGAMRATRGGRRYDAAVGDVLRWDPDGRHEGVAADGGSWRARLLLVELPTLRRWALDDEDARSPALTFGAPVVRRPDLAARLLDVHARLERGEDALGSQTAFLALVRDLLDVDAGRVDRVRISPAVRDARTYLEEHVERNVTLEELAAACGVGRFRLVREFTAHVGVPPHRYLLARRLSRARLGLERGADIAALALELGFVDQSHLHRHFRKAFATTPAAYRRAFQAR